MAVILYLFEKFGFHVAAVARQIVARQIYQHDMLGILLGVGRKSFSRLRVGLRVSRAARRAGYGVDPCVASLDAAVGLGRGAEDAGTAEIEVEEIWRRVDGAQRTVELEVVARIRLYEAARKYDLEDVAAQAVGNAAVDVGKVLLVGEGAAALPLGAEVIDGEVAVRDAALDLVQHRGLVAGAYLGEDHLVVAVVEYDHIFI